MRTITLTLGGRVFTVKQLAMRAEQQWRGQVGEVMESLQTALTMGNRAIGSGADLAEAVRAAGTLSDGPALLEALIAYAPELAAEREWLLENAYSDEVAEAVVALFFARGAKAQAAAPVLNGALG